MSSPEESVSAAPRTSPAVLRAAITNIDDVALLRELMALCRKQIRTVLRLVPKRSIQPYRVKGRTYWKEMWMEDGKICNRYIGKELSVEERDRYEAQLERRRGRGKAQRTPGE